MVVTNQHAHPHAEYALPGKILDNAHMATNVCFTMHGQDAPSNPQPTTKSVSFDDDATVHATSTFPTCSWCQKSHDQNKICSEQQRYIDKRTKALAAKEEEKSKPLFGKYPRKPQVSQIYLDTSEEDAIFDESDDSDDYSCY